MESKVNSTVFRLIFFFFTSTSDLNKVLINGL